MKRKREKKSLFIILLIVLLLALAVGYAAFSDILTISGTANAKGTFDLEFQNAEVVSAVGADKENTTAQISADKNTLTVKAADLAYPGAGVEYSVDIVNVGSMPAGVKAVTPVGLEGSEHIKIKGLDVIKADHPTIEAGGKCNIHFTVEWPADSTTALTDGAEDAEFSLQIEYEQATTEMFTGSAKHEDGEGGSTGGEVEHVHNYIATELKDCSDEIKGVYNFKDVTVSGPHSGNESVAPYDGVTVGDVFYVPETVDKEFHGPTYTLTKGYHEVTSVGSTVGTTLLGENYPIQVCSCGDYITE